MTRFTACFLFILLPALAHGEISVRIFARSKPLTVIFTPSSGEYFIHTSSSDSIPVAVNEPVIVTRYDDNVILKMKTGASVAISSVIFTPSGEGCQFTLRAIGKSDPVKLLNGTLKIGSFPGSLLVINITDIEDYLPGVVRAEAGSKGPADYFRAQAIVARTFAYRNIDRHMLDGYDLCDDTHCQVYPGIIPETTIADACRSTAGMILTDRDSILIYSAFHANCGGETAPSSDVWVSTQYYLKAVKDPYCSSSASARWQKTIPASTWVGFLRTKGIIEDSRSPVITSPQEETKRMKYMMIAGKSLSYDEIRAEFNLRSSFFTVVPAADSVIIRGRGYGHGVGLCQDGARGMAARGKGHREITAFYYPGTLLMDVKNARKPVRL
jgi:stage II sporulation protein D